MSTVKFDTWKSSDGAEEYYKCRAWVNFDGTQALEENMIRAAGNVGSITDNGVGNYTVNLLNILSNSDYCMSISATVLTVRNLFAAPFTSPPTTSTVRIQCSGHDGLANDPDYAFVSIFQ